MEEFKISNISTIATATHNILRYDAKELRDGNVEITEEQYKKAREKLETFREILEGYSDVKRIWLFYKGLLFCTEIEGISIERLKQKSIEALETGKLPPMPTIEEVVQFCNVAPFFYPCVDLGGRRILT